MDKKEYKKFACLPPNDNVTINMELIQKLKRMPGRGVFGYYDNYLVGNIRSCDICGRDKLSSDYKGIEWYQGDADDEEISRTMCFDCIFRCCLQFHARERFIERTGIDPISNLQTQIKTLRTELDELKDQLRKS